MAKRRYDAEEEIYYFIRLYAAVGLVCHRWSEENGLEGGADEFDPVKSHPPLLETLLNGTRGQKLPYLWQDEHGVLFAGIQAYGACYLLGPAVAGPLDVVTLHRYYFDYGMKRGMEKQIPVLSFTRFLAVVQLVYLYLTGDGETQPVGNGLQMTAKLTDDTVRAVIAYDDIASINYFGDLCKAWYRRNGLQITDAIHYAFEHFDELLNRCDRLDAEIERDSLAAGGEDYAILTAASWRQVMAAHKLIATPEGEMAYLSKENDSNGCIGTVDISYPSSPLFLRYNPELVNAMCRPVLKFASMPVWTDDFAPHDIGRYPLATGQVYAAVHRVGAKETHPPYYLYPASSSIYDPRGQMPVEECGNMLVMLEAAVAYGADDALVRQYRPLLDQWVRYLLTYGEDPGEQLCTDDFAGHLAHNVNLAMKAIVGVACYGRLIGDEVYIEKARGMAERLLKKIGECGNTPLTLDGQGWSMKYNLLWDKVLHLSLISEAFYASETKSYLARMNTYGLPLDSRADYTKSDWLCWVAALAEDMDVRRALIAPIARMLRETTSRVPFSDWYDTKTGRFVAFIGRSVQGGLFAPMLRL